MSPTVATILTLLAYLCLGVVAVAVASIIGHNIIGLLERRHHGNDALAGKTEGRRRHSPASTDGLGDSESVPFGDRATELRQSTRPGETSRAGSRTRAERPGESTPGSRERGTVRAGRGTLPDDGIGLERTPRPADGRDTLSYRAGIEWRMVAWTVDALYGDLA